MEKTNVPIHFRSIKDFRNRICGLWQDQKDNENYDFTFANQEVEDEFNNLVESFNAINKNLFIDTMIV
jgi:hypothetical protein